MCYLISSFLSPLELICLAKARHVRLYWASVVRGVRVWSYFAVVSRVLVLNSITAQRDHHRRIKNDALLPTSLSVFSYAQALEGQRDGLKHLMRIVKKDKQDLEVREGCRLLHNRLFIHPKYVTNSVFAEQAQRDRGVCFGESRTRKAVEMHQLKRRVHNATLVKQKLILSQPQALFPSRSPQGRLRQKIVKAL